VRRLERRLAWTTIAIILVLGTATTILALAGRIEVATGPVDAGRIAVEGIAWLAIVELYLYGLHRLMHTRAMFRRVHRLHHLSAATDAWTALSLHPVEALAAFGIFPVLVVAHPVHVATIVGVSTFMILMLVGTHVNREPVPRAWHESALTSWLTTPLVHVGHHSDARANFGAATTLPDRLFGTHRVDLSWYDAAPSSWRRPTAGGTRPA
jgi:sterol desaturase/sphingolipid hydroxylase (fatty acid hydroxylase superfamily)